ncbi:MAG: hypothetical protein ACRERD_15655 [Candidatus Binatia bacterium]
METYILGLGLLGVVSAVLMAAFALIQVSLTTREIHKTTEASPQGIQELMRRSDVGRQETQHLIRSGEATLKIAEATLREVMEIRQRGLQLH